jgi:hypothetical protein
MVVFHANRTQPELCCLLVTLDVYMNWFATIAGEEKEPIWTALQNRRAHTVILPVFDEPAKFDPIRPTSSMACSIR